MSKRVYFFGPQGAEGTATMKERLGGKGANLAEMCNLKIPVPAGFTIATDCCVDYFGNGGEWPHGLVDEVGKNLKKLEKEMGKRFGDPADPLLLSVRSGARASMPGMMDTILNLGLNDTTVDGLIARTGNERFARDSYRRFITMFGDVVLGVDRQKFEQGLSAARVAEKVKYDSELSAATLDRLIDDYKAIITAETGADFPQEPSEQLRLAIGAVFDSWHNERAEAYRRMYRIPASWGTAVNVQAMVFGNRGADSGTGVAFTRDPSTGERKFFGEFLFDAQGEDVVAGIRTPLTIDEMGAKLPKPKDDLDRIYRRLEKHYRDMLDIEFTVEAGKLWMLQCRVGKRTAAAAVRIAVEMVNEKLISRSEAIVRVEPTQLDQLLHDTIDPTTTTAPLCAGLPASPGAGVGAVVFTAAEAVAAVAEGKKVILVRHETSPEDIGGMAVAEGILTATGGMTSHAAVVARGMGRCCVAGVEEVHINDDRRSFHVGDTVVKAGDFLTLDGATGRVFCGRLTLVKPELPREYHILMKWADTARRMAVRTNADTPHDAKLARSFGAEGIGLTRTEHMFFEGDRIIAVREMILAATREERQEALAKLLPMQRDDFIGIFEAMEGTPCTIRLLDPPLHEFLPKEESDYEAVASDMGVSVEQLHDRATAHHEFNPMLGHRGCRLGVTHPEIYAMQSRAIIEAACDLARRGLDVHPEIMIPLVADVEELRRLRPLVVEVADEVIARSGQKVSYSVGTMIELPRAALTAHRIAEEADFFSFGTNDLTQTTFGLSRDDAGRFLPHYVTSGLLPDDPFVVLDQEGVGELLKIGIERGRKTKPGLKVGLCGEHGGEPSSVIFCHRLGFDYVSCSPYRVPVARLAAAHAAIRDEEGKSKRVARKKAANKERALKATVAKKKKVANKKRATRWTAAQKREAQKTREKEAKEAAERRARKSGKSAEKKKRR